MVLIGGFIIALGTGALPEESISVSAALLTLLATGLLQNLRSIISESSGIEDTNGHDLPSVGKANKKEKV